MRTKEYTITGFALDRDGIVAAANPVAATPMTLLATTLSPPREIAIYSAADQSSLTFTVVGTDRNGFSITETITGPNNATVRGKKVFATLTSITPSASNGNNTEVGWVARTVTPWVICGLWTGKEGQALSTAKVSVIELTGAGDGDVEITYDFPNDSTGEEHSIDASVAVTPGTPVDAQGIMCRFVLTSGAATGATARFARPG